MSLKCNVPVIKETKYKTYKLSINVSFEDCQMENEMLNKIIKVLATALIVTVHVQPAFARDQIRIVGSSTV